MTVEERTALDADATYGDWLAERMREPVTSRAGVPEHKRVVRGHLRGRDGRLVRDDMCGTCRQGEPYLD